MFLRQKYNSKITEAFETVSIVVLIGARQVGKTSIMNTVELTGKKLFLNGQDPEIAMLFQKFSVLKEYLRINLNEELSGYLVIDEFQFIEGVSTMLKLISDTLPNLNVLCSGSSSLDILQRVEESLAGRVRIIEVFSLSFEEYLNFSDNDLYTKYQKYSLATTDEIVERQISIRLHEYLNYGGMPRAVMAKTPNRKIDILNDIYTTYLLRDVRNFIRNEDVVGFNKLLKLLSAQIGGLVNTNELSVSSGLSYKKTDEYLYLLEQMYIIKLLEPYHTNRRKVVGKMRKVFFNDLGLRNMIYNNFNDIEIRNDNGALFENFVFLELKRIMGSGMLINFYRSLDGAEVDFVINTLKEQIAIEVKFKNLTKPVSLKGFNSFCELEEIKKSFIVNRTFNNSFGNTKYLQGYLVGKIEFK